MKNIYLACIIACLSLSLTLRAQTNTINGHEYVDLGLSVKWATCNVWAYLPSDTGDYYAWGETATKEDYSQNSSETFGKGSMSDIRGTSRDVARKEWGIPWRMPTKAEFEELLNNCTWTWTTQDSRRGYCIISKLNGNSIFLPAAGARYGTSSPSDVNSNGYYWCSTPDGSNGSGAIRLHFYNSYRGLNWDCRIKGYPVRPVTK